MKWKKKYLNNTSVDYTSIRAIQFDFKNFVWIYNHIFRLVREDDVIMHLPDKTHNIITCIICNETRLNFCASFGHNLQFYDLYLSVLKLLDIMKWLTSQYYNMPLIPLLCKNLPFCKVLAFPFVFCTPVT